jgi:MerR family transcriptional regulator, mercuric resistance operon regulatory protein
MGAIKSSRAENLPIGELSKRSGVNIETIRYYERVKVLAPPPRTDSGRRVYLLVCCSQPIRDVVIDL